MITSGLAWLAILMMTWQPLPGSDRSMEVRLCSGATLDLPLGNNDDVPFESASKACHVTDCRKRSPSLLRPIT